MIRKSNAEKVKPLPSREELNRILQYNSETGELFWRVRPLSDFSTERSCKIWNKRYAGQPALNSISANGYKRGRIFYDVVVSHRVIWKMMTGKEPCVIDHINGDRTDNRWINLRDVDDQTNMLNKKEYASNKSGVNGVYWNKALGKWHAQMKVGDKRLHLGFFHDIDDARDARLKAEKENNFHTNHGRKENSYGS